MAKKPWSIMYHSKEYCICSFSETIQYLYLLLSLTNTTWNCVIQIVLCNTIRLLLANLILTFLQLLVKYLYIENFYNTRVLTARREYTQWGYCQIGHFLKSVGTTNIEMRIYFPELYWPIFPLSFSFIQYPFWGRRNCCS